MQPAESSLPGPPAERAADRIRALEAALASASDPVVRRGLAVALRVEQELQRMGA